MRLGYPLQYFTNDLYAFEMWQIYEMIFNAHYGRIEGMNHSGTREQFLGETVK